MSGQLDWAGNDIPNVYANFVNLNPLTNHAWFAAGSTVTLWFNLNPGNGGATGIGDAAVRKAVSYGVDRNALALLGESGYELPASSSSALILPNQKAFLPTDGSLTNDLSISGSVPDAATAKAQKLPAGADVYDILKGGGLDAAGDLALRPAPAPSSPAATATAATAPTAGPRAARSSTSPIYDPVPFSDYWENAALMSQELQALGMDVTTKPAQGYSDWNTNITSNPDRVADRHPLGQRRQHPVHPVPGLARQHQLNLDGALRGIFQPGRAGGPQTSTRAPTPATRRAVPRPSSSSPRSCRPTFLKRRCSTARTGTSTAAPSTPAGRTSRTRT